MTRPLVSVITGTWQRHDLLMQAVETVRRQSYRPVEHIIVSDGPDPILRNLLARVIAEADPTDPPIHFTELGRNWSTIIPESISAPPFMTAQLLARGEYVCWLSDDEEMLDSDHITKLVDLIEATGADFVYPLVEVWRKSRPDQKWIVGADPPENGTITHCLHRYDCLNAFGGGFRVSVGSGTDWDQIVRWMSAGKTWAHLPEVTFRHRSDKFW
jgi:glycosyltransferase involved in cell wall biosynthesis